MVIDSGGLDRAVIYVQTGGERTIYLGGDKRREIEEVFDIGDLLRLIHGGYDVRVNVTDINGNWATGKTHIDSALQTLKKGLSALLDMIVAALKVIAKVASMLIEVIKKIVMGILNPVIEPIKEGLYKYVSGVEYTFEITVENPTAENIELLASKIFGGSFVLSISLMILVLATISTIIMPFTGVIGTLIDLVIDFVTPMIFNAIMKYIPEDNTINIIFILFSGDIFSFIDTIPTMLKLNYKGNELNRSIIGDIATKVGLICSIIGLVLSAGGLFYAGRKYFILKDVSKLPKGIGGIIGDSLGLLLSALGVVLSVVSTSIQTAILGLVIAGFGLITCNYFDSSLVNRLFNKLSMIVAWVGFIAAAISAVDTACDVINTDRGETGG